MCITDGYRQLLNIDVNIVKLWSSFKVESGIHDTSINVVLVFAELIQIHDETLEKTREWFSTISPETKTRLDNHYGDMPTVESDYWDLPNGPSWHWWTIAILPLDPQAQVVI